jgi:hypothetical protein
MVHIFFVIHLCLFFGVNDCCRNFGRQKERSKEKLSAAPASTAVVSEVGTVVAEPANAEFKVKLGQCFWMVVTCRRCYFLWPFSTMSFRPTGENFTN